MTTNTILLLLLSFLIASGLSFYHYIYKSKNTAKINWFLAFLRFISIFGILILLINPIISSKTFEIIKTPLAVVVDNSNSIIDLKATASATASFEKIKSNSAIQDKFDVQNYQFDADFQSSEKFDFKGKQTNIEQVAKSLKSINKNPNYPVVLISDGNQTSGNDYVHAFQPQTKVYPVVLGDTTTFLDLKVSQLNVNCYAFYKNKFPAEVFLNYSGTKSITADFSISQGNTVLNKQTVSFSPNNKSAIINVLLPAEKVGLQIYKATISSKIIEKNSYNNIKNFAVEVIDQKTNIALVSSINHPDLGALKRAIETNAQRKVTIVKPNEINSLQEYNILILYQPTNAFKTIFDQNKLAGINTFFITGTSTDFNILNQYQQNLVFKMSAQKEDYLAGFNSQFNLYALDNFGFEHYPPLQNLFGTITTNSNVTTLLNSKIRNIETKAPLLCYSENQGKRSAYLLGENSWKWRLQCHSENKSFEKYDQFIDKSIQFLASSNTKKSLVVSHESFYNSGDKIEITAQYFNKNFEIDEKANLTIALTNTNTKVVKKYDFLKSNNSFKVNLDGLSAGKYTFVVKEQNTNSSYAGYFEILDFDIEKQFVNPDLDNLKRLANQTNAAVFMPNQVDQLIDQLIKNQDYKAIQKAIVKKTPLIDWVWLLVLIASSLAAEWFIRKYNGML